MKKKLSKEGSRIVAIILNDRICFRTYINSVQFFDSIALSTDKKFPAIKAVLDGFELELNDEITRSQVRTSIFNHMEDIKASHGVYDYKVVCDDTNNTPQDIDNCKLNICLFAKPTESAEYIQYTIQL